jgi:hypothetical protein
MEPTQSVEDVILPCVEAEQLAAAQRLDNQRGSQAPQR